MLNSLYEKAITKKGLHFEIEVDSNNDVEKQLKGRWFDRFIKKSTDDFSIAAGDGSFNKKKFITANFCAIDAESVIHDGCLIKTEESDLFKIGNVSFLDELLSNYMAIFELKCALRAIKKYNVDYYMFDGSILGDLQNAFPRGAKLPNKIRDNLNDLIIPEFESRLKINHYGLVFPEIRDDFNFVESEKHDDIGYIEQINLHLASIEKIVLLKELLNYRKKIVSISKSSSSNSLFTWNIPDIAVLDRFTKMQGMTRLEEEEISKHANFPSYNDFFKSLKFTVFYVRLEDYQNVFKVELPYDSSRQDVFRLIEKLKKYSVKGYPYLLNMAHNDVVIKDKNIRELLKIAKIYETTNREML